MSEMFILSRELLYEGFAYLLIAKEAFFGPMSTGVCCPCGFFEVLVFFAKEHFSALTDGVT